MPVQAALDALKRKDFATARDLIAGMDAAACEIQHFLIKGLAEFSMKDWRAARDTFTAASVKFPAHAPFWFNRGLANENLDLTAAAIASHEQCLRLNQNFAEAYGNLSNLYRKQKNFTKAEAMARQAVELGAEKNEALNCLGLALAAQGKFTEADKALRDAHNATPHHADIIFNRANLEIDRLHFDAAWPLFSAARTINDKADYRHSEGLALLLAGDYENGWRLFEARLEMAGALRVTPPCPRWRSENLRGKKLLIVAEQGFGDVIQFCRYGQFIDEGDLVWAVPQPLVRLLNNWVRGEVVDEKSPLPACDYYIPIMSLPLACQQFAPAPVHNAPSVSATPTLPQGHHKNKIGLVWAGSPTHQRDHERSIPLQMFAPIVDMDADFYAPFSGKGLDEIGALTFTRLDHLIKDFTDTAALLKQLDILITVDTAVAHVAGALGVKTFLLLPYCPDFRWGVAGDKTDWYPSLTLIRQSHYGDWQSAIAQLKELLESGF